ncbi:GL23921 [Drosophila persimilis]|uniref:GL23921 n=1 Tax=Drosophila persimilis TaxID=7234 RepID=B4HCR1_DROPE|nr:GL23921 [Drosophila persimilis]
MCSIFRNRINYRGGTGTRNGSAGGDRERDKERERENLLAKELDADSNGGIEAIAPSF